MFTSFVGSGYTFESCFKTVIVFKNSWRDMFGCIFGVTNCWCCGGKVLRRIVNSCIRCDIGIEGYIIWYHIIFVILLFIIGMLFLVFLCYEICEPDVIYESV
jgi:hypothetical protein